MKLAIKNSIKPKTVNVLKPFVYNTEQIRKCINEAWTTIAPLWPLKNIIARNPLSGFEDLPFEEAYKIGAYYFQRSDIPQELQNINRETIKWCQAFFDDGQATIIMPSRHQGFYKSWKSLAIFDQRLTKSNKKHEAWLASLPEDMELAIAYCLEKLNIPADKQSTFLTLILTSLPGWAGYVKYRADWCDLDSQYLNPVGLVDYLAVRMIITCLVSPNASELLNKKSELEHDECDVILTDIKNRENTYRKSLLNQLSHVTKTIENKNIEKKPDAQLIFCIDVRSEPFRRSIEAQGNYETLGFAGFFGIPLSVHEFDSHEIVASCPVLLKPQHIVEETVACSTKMLHNDKNRKNVITSGTRLYQSLKYTFTTPFALVETLGPFLGILMGLKTMLPHQTLRLKKSLINFIRPPLQKTASISLTKNDSKQNINGISHDDQCKYAENALRMMGLTRNFAPIVLLCGHGSATQNNPYASALDCGACGGRHGGFNAQTLAAILNTENVRKYLLESGIMIPQETQFLAGEHNTTTDELNIFSVKSVEKFLNTKIKKLQNDLKLAREFNTAWRCKEMGIKEEKSNSVGNTLERSADWAQTRPEWGLARNAAFIVGPRKLTKNVDLEGRSFLHSYDWEQDPQGSSLETILTAPMVVAQWINNQYLFSTLDNVAYGSGSKITQNITGKLGIMQGNASDLMHGLSLQSVNTCDMKSYHDPLRLFTIVYAPTSHIDPIIKRQNVLQKLFGNEWVTLAAIDPITNKVNILDSSMNWMEA